ncbi:MAG: sigma-70 family RNA polymerase sigma factor [Verrucomicrobia bacterium]|nr:sigma-70 family RNA polymerase sigma factor [Verrucomicrobiota bacterium]
MVSTATADESQLSLANPPPPATMRMEASSSDEQDAQDMARLTAGHDAALNDLMARHAARLFRFLVRSLQDEEDAADLAQETFVKVYQNRAKFDARRKFSTWLYAIAANLVRDRFRWRSRHPRVSLDAENDKTGNKFQEALPENRPSPSDCALADERAEAVRRAIAELPEELRLPLILAEYEEHSHAEIGEIFGYSAKAVEMRLYRARQQLRASLGALLESH